MHARTHEHSKADVEWWRGNLSEKADRMQLSQDCSYLSVLKMFHGKVQCNLDRNYPKLLGAT
jgi:hypothetical protein